MINRTTHAHTHSSTASIRTHANRRLIPRTPPTTPLPNDVPIKGMGNVQYALCGIRHDEMRLRGETVGALYRQAEHLRV